MADVTTVIGDTIRLQGHLQGDEDLTVLGRVDGTIELTKTLIVEPSGVVKADVTVQNAIISGVVVGNVTASDSVEITKEGRMVGDISSPRVILVDGASFRGDIDMGDLELPRPTSSNFGKPKTTPSARPASRSTAETAPPAAPAKSRAAEPELVEEVVVSKAPTRASSTARGTSKKAATAPPKAVPMRGKKRRVAIKKR